MVNLLTLFACKEPLALQEKRKEKKINATNFEYLLLFCVKAQNQHVRFRKL